MQSGPTSSLPSDLGVQELQAFLIVTEEFHFGRAAQRLFLSQPQMSRIVAGHISASSSDRFRRPSAAATLAAAAASDSSFVTQT